MNKKGQWSHIAAREQRTQERTLRKNYARVLHLLGFGINETVNFLNVSTQTVKTYLKETEGVAYSDLAEQVYDPEIFNLFTWKEQKLLSEFRNLSARSKSLPAESQRIHKIIHKKNISGWFIHKFGNVEKYKKRKEEISRELDRITKQAQKLTEKFSDKKMCPHIANSSLNFLVEREQSWACDKRDK